MKNKKYITHSEHFQIISHNRNTSKIYHTVGTLPTYNSKMVERGKINIPNTCIILYLSSKKNEAYKL